MSFVHGALLLATVAARAAAAASQYAIISNSIPRRDSRTGLIVNAHAGGIYNFSNHFFLLGEHYKYDDDDDIKVKARYREYGEF